MAIISSNIGDNEFSFRKKERKVSINWINSFS